MSRKHLIAIIVCFIASVTLTGVGLEISDTTLLSAFFTIDGIMFSIGLSLIVTFNFSNIKDTDFLKKMRSNLNNVRNLFIFLFSVSSLFFIASLMHPKTIVYLVPIVNEHLQFNPGLFSSLLIFYTIFYFIVNFIEIQNLNNDIVDKINNEENNS